MQKLPVKRDIAGDRSVVVAEEATKVEANSLLANECRVRKRNFLRDLILKNAFREADELVVLLVEDARQEEIWHLEDLQNFEVGVEFRQVVVLLELLEVREVVLDEALMLPAFLEDEEVASGGEEDLLDEEIWVGEAVELGFLVKIG